MTRDTRGARRSAGWHILGAIVAIGVGGCAAELDEAPLLDDGVAEADAVERIDAETFAQIDDGVEVWLDLRDPGRGYVVDTPAVPLERLSLICPDGTVMPWLDWAAADPALDGRVRGEVGLASSVRLAEEAARQADNPCPSDCYTCADGATLCHPDWGCLDENDLTVSGSVNSIEREVFRDSWGTGSPFGTDPAPSPDGEEGSDGESDPTDPRSGGDYGGGGGSGSSGSGSSGSGSSGGGGGSPGGHPGW